MQQSQQVQSYTAKEMRRNAQALLDGVSDGGNIGKVDGRVNPDQQHTLLLLSLRVLQDVPAHTHRHQMSLAHAHGRCALIQGAPGCSCAHAQT